MHFFILARPENLCYTENKKKKEVFFMKTLLFYFSATGNSLTTARAIAAALEDCTLVPVAALKDKETVRIPADVEKVGFVYPVYYSDFPHLVRRVISKMEFEGTPYIFSVCTCRGHFGIVAQRLDALLQTRGQKLSRHLCVFLPGNSRVSPPEKDAEQLADQERATKEMLAMLTQWTVEDCSPREELKDSPVHDAANMRGLLTEDNCIGCGTCVQVCPMNNVSLADGHAVMGNECVSCLACYHWCPQKAIIMSTGEPEMVRRRQYRHPAVTLQDILAQKKL